MQNKKKSLCKSLKNDGPYRGYFTISSAHMMPFVQHLHESVFNFVLLQRQNDAQSRSLTLKNISMNFSGKWK